jgi:hypothetical protein
MSDDLYAGDESSGLLSHFIGRVKTSLWSTFFAETDGKASGDASQTYLLFWHCDVIDILQANYESSGVPVESNMLSFGIGKGWYPKTDNPNLIEHEDETNNPGHVKKFRADTGFMKFVYNVAGKSNGYDGAVVLDGDDEDYKVDLTGAAAVHAKMPNATLKDSTIWHNMIFEFRGLGYPTRDYPRPKPRPTPVRYLGYEEGELVDLSSYSGNSGSTANSAGASTRGLGAVDPGQVAAWQEAGASDPTVTMLTRVWESSPSLDHFIRNAGLLPDVKANEKLANAVLDAGMNAVSESASETETA